MRKEECGHWSPELSPTLGGACEQHPLSREHSTPGLMLGQEERVCVLTPPAAIRARYSRPRSPLLGFTPPIHL